MVFENVVSQLLNRVLGDYVENLDASQLNIGIFGGDVRLQNLDVKPTALNDLGLPVKLKFGTLSNLVLKIPWKRIYKEPVVAIIEGLHVLVVPNIEIKYDEAKEKMQQQLRKEKELARLEEARNLRRKSKKGLLKTDDARGKVTQDSFTEKVVTLIVKNLQVSIRDIHIRYEDRVTNKERPFAAAITLNGLEFQTTDKEWKKCVITEAVKQIYKIIELDSLAIYWNSGAKLLSDLTSAGEIKKQMKEAVASNKSKPAGNSYVLQPISINAKLRLNTKPESDNSNWTIPKTLLNVEVAQLGVHMGKHQYQDVLQFLEAQERLVLRGKYRKYRPNVSRYKGESKKWWRFAYQCILEEHVRRRARNWRWAHMKAHIKLVKEYKEVWIDMLTNKNPNAETMAIVEKAEKQLDVFNLNIARQQADMEVDKRGLIRIEDQAGLLRRASNWLGSFGVGAADKTKSTNFVTKFEAEMTSSEKTKLFEAIDYQESAPPKKYPIAYVEDKFCFILHKLDVVVDDNPEIGKTHEVMRFTLTKVVADVEQRSSDRAMAIVVSLKDVEMKGIASKSGPAPVIVKLGIPVTDKSPPLIALNVQIRPLSRAFDHGVTLTVQSLHIIYHAPTINAIAVVFRPPEVVRLNQLSETAMARYEDVRIQSAAGLALAVEKRSKLMLDIKVMPTMVLVPEKGLYTKNSSLLVTDLGSLTVKTVDSTSSSVKSTLTSSPIDAKVQKLMIDAYDNISVELQTLQLLYAKPTDDWNAARKKPLTSLHLLQPTGFKILVQKSTIDDLRIPKVKITAALPDLILNLSDERLLEILKLLLSIPAPPPAPVDLFVTSPLKDQVKMHAFAELRREAKAPKVPSTKLSISTSQSNTLSFNRNPQMVKLEAVFTLSTIALNISRRSEGGVDSPYINLRVRSLGADIQIRTFDLVASSYLRSIEIEMMQFKGIGKTSGRSLFLVDNPYKEKADGDLLTLKFVQASRQSPTFDEEYESTEHHLQIHFSALHVALHQRALIDLKVFADNLQTKLTAVRELYGRVTVKSATTTRLRLNSNSSLASVGSHFAETVNKMSPLHPPPGTGRGKKSQRLSESGLIKTKVEASLGQVKLSIGTDRAHITTVGVSDLKTNVEIRKERTLLETTLKSVWINDERPSAKHPHLLSVTGHEVFSLRLTQFTRTRQQKQAMKVRDVDIDVSMMMNELRFIFLNAWLNNLLAWVSPFQEEAQTAVAVGAALSETALETAKTIRMAQPKARLNIDLKAPTIFIPQRSCSAESIVINLGRVSIANQFIKSKDAVIVDKLTLNLTGLQVVRAVLGNNYTMVAHCEMLQPMSMMLQVQRNLLFESQKSIAELKLRGDIPVIKISLSQEDYAMLMKTMNGNLAEGNPPPRLVVKPPAPANRRASTVAAVESTMEELKTPPLIPAVKIDMDLTLRGLEARLYSGSSHLDKGLASRREFQKFASVVMSKVTIEGDILEDNSLTVRVSLAAFTMDDERQRGNSKITRLLDKKAKESNLVEISIHKTANEDQNVIIRMCSFFLCLNPEFLGSLSRFFSVSSDLSDAHTAAAPSTVTSTLTSASKPPMPPPASKGKLRVKANLETAEIILVEDASKPDKTRAVILQLRMEADVSGDADGLQVQGGVKDLEIFSSFYAVEKRDQKRKVLAPCCIDMQMKHNETSGQNIQLAVTDVELRCTPVIIRLLSAVAAGMSAPKEVTAEEKRRKLEQLLSDSSRLTVWQPKKLEPLNYWFFRDALEKQSEVEVVTVAQAVDPVEKQNLQFTLNSIDVRLEAGVGNRTVPLILIESSLSAHASNWSSQLIATITSSIEVRYFNEMFSCWEPVVEQIEGKPGHYKPWELNLQVQNHSKDIDVEDSAVGKKLPKISILLYSTDILQTTITKSCLDVMTKLGNAFRRAAKQIEPPKVKELPGTSPYVIKNETGIPMAIIPSTTLTFVDRSENERRVEHGEVVEMILKIRKKTLAPRLARVSMDEHTVLLRFGSDSVVAAGDASTMREVNVSRAQLRSFSLPARSASGDQWQLVSQVTTEFGRRMVTFRSTIQIVNHLTYPVQVYSLIGTDLEDCGLVPSNDGILNIAMPAIYSSDGQFFFKPIVGDNLCDVTAESLNWRQFSTLTVLHTMLRSRYTNSPKNSFYIQANFSVDPSLRENTTKRALTSQAFHIDLRPPVVVRNALPYILSVPLANDAVTVGRLAGGESVSLHNVKPGKAKLKLTVAAAEDYHCEFAVKDEMTELRGYEFKTESKKTMTLGVRSVCTNGRHEFTVYCPFWMVNETGMTLAYKLIGMFHINRRLVLKKPSVRSARSDSAKKLSADGHSSRSSSRQQVSASSIDRKDSARSRTVSPSSKRGSKRGLWPFARGKSSPPDKGKNGGGEKKRSAKQLWPVTRKKATDDSRSLEHPPNMGEPLMFSFPNKDFNTSKKTMLRVFDSEWSDAFPLDVVGSSGRITCKNTEGRSYDVSVKVTLANGGLTKICVFTPFYLINNQCRLPVATSEGVAGDEWQTVAAKTCSGFWPTTPLRDKQKSVLRARFVDDGEADVTGEVEQTTPFPYTETFESLAKLNNMHVGIYVTVGVDESQVVITLEDYQKGMSSALLINATEHQVAFKQNGMTESQLLEPQTEQYFCWSDLTENREITWSCESFKDMKDGLFKDGSDACTKMGSDVPIYYWTSFLDGRQRVLLFVDDLAVAQKATEGFEIEHIEQQITISLEGIGLSLVNNHIGMEVAYVCILSTGGMWETMQKQRFKPMGNNDRMQMEAAYTRYLKRLNAGTVTNHTVALEKGKEVDFKQMCIIKPKKVQIRRIFHRGLWMQYKTSQHQVHFHVKLNHLQIDNQLRGCVFKVVLSPVPVPKTVIADSGPKPFTEMSFVMRKTDHSNVAQIKYFKVLVQEMALQVDTGFINALIEIIQNVNERDAQDGCELFNKDMELTKVNLTSVAVVTSSTDVKAFYDMLHFSPLKVHLSFSQGGNSHLEDAETDKTASPIQSEFLNLLLQSVGVTLTEIQDVVFKLAYFEREHVFLNQPQLIAEATDHYTKQAIKQIYVLVLGLDIIGNPFGLLRDLTTGVEDFFYEPISGAVQGPEEFAEGLSTGVKSLVSHTVGGAAGAVSRITGTLGKGLAALTLDDEYKRKRQEALNCRPSSFGEGIARGGIGVVTGVVGGVTGVVSKPIEGAQQQGATGFAKGLGKGLVGVCVRPASGIVDFASGSMDAVRKVVDMTQEVTSVRPARYIHPDKIVRPYSKKDAEGYHLIRECQKGKYAGTDVYITHAPLNATDKTFLFVTDRRVLLGRRCSIFGVLKEEWQYPWDQLKRCPTLINENAILIEFKGVRGKLMGVVGGSTGKTVQFTSTATAKWMCDKIAEVYKT